MNLRPYQSRLSQPEVARETLDQIRRCTAEVIGQFISLKASGASFKALCPFHDDNNPSLSIKGEYFKCWSCGTAGDVFDFVMLAENVTFPKAIRIAAEIAGVALKDETPSAAAVIHREDGIRDVLKRWREETRRACATDLRERDELIRVAQVSFEGGTIDEATLFHALAVAYRGYSLLEYRFWQLRRDDLFSNLELWRLARREAA
jgi:DNA primase